jgi:hypothetical protein
VGSLYRCINHPTLTVKEQFNEFSEIFNNLLGNLSSFELLLGGDLNLDALKINTCPLVSSYLDSLYANGFIQSVTKLTRCTAASATCIEHYLTNFSQELYETVVVVGRVSDHFPVLFLKEQSRKHAKIKPNLIRDFSENNVACFSDQLSTTGWGGITGENDPGAAFDNFTVLFKAIHDNFFTPKSTKFNKNIHKKIPG